MEAHLPNQPIQLALIDLEHILQTEAVRQHALQIAYRRGGDRVEGLAGEHQGYEGLEALGLRRRGRVGEDGAAHGVDGGRDRGAHRGD